MKITNDTLLKSLQRFILILILVLVSTSAFSQQIPTGQDTTATAKTGFSLGSMNMPNPQSIVSKYTYDPVTDRYIYTESVGKFNINYPIILTPAEFQKLVLQEQQQLYYKQKIDAKEGKKEGAEEEQKNLLPEFYINSGFFETVFGGNTIEVIPQGSVEMDLGILYTKQDNPTFSPRNRSNFTFDFDQRISLSLLGKVGTRLQVTANYDTESTFDFQNLIKLEYTPTEDDIVRKIEVGNVAMPLNSSLITGAQSLFGVKTELQFGKTRVTAIFSEQRSQSQSVTAQGGGTLEEFEFFARDYDENRHFFLAQHFRNNYDEAMLRYPYINNNIQITRVEVWVTNRSNQTDNVRNLAAFQDLGESEVIGLNSPPPGFVNVGANQPPDNGNNDFDPTNIAGPGSLLSPLVRDITTVEQGIQVPANEGFDFGKLENARKLQEGSDYQLQQQLGYISLNQRLLNDEILAVAFQYTIGGEVYQVGEFANDGVNSTATNNDDDQDGIPNDADVDVNGDGSPDNGTDTDGDGINDATDADVNGDGTLDNGTDFDGDGINDNSIVLEGSTQSLIVKMLKSPVTSVDQPIWDLMMKNIYDTGAFQLEKDDFKLNIFYTEASPLNYISPVVLSDGTTIPFPTFDNNSPFDTTDDGEIVDTPLIRLFHLDRLNFNNDPQAGGDGFFDYVEGMTVLSQNGKIIFTKVEPFGRYLFDVLDDDGNPNDNAADYEEETYTNLNQEKYVYDILYKETKTAALDEAEKNKFQIKGRYKSSGGDGIPLGAFNVPRGSVVVTAGGRTLVEGVDYTVNYQIGRVQILDEALKASNIPINVSVENNAVFGQQTKRFTGVNVEHQFNENFVLGATILNLSERPITQKANYNTEPINNTIFGFNGNYSTEIPFFTRLVNKLPNVDTDVPSNLSVRGEFAYLAPGAPKGTDFNNEATAYVDDFEGTQGAIDLLSPQSWFLSSRPRLLGKTYPGFIGEDENGLQNGFDRAMLNWYTIDPIFYSSQRPGEITDDDVSNLYTRRIFIDEVFPEINVAQGQQTIINSLDLAYYPTERGPYNFDPDATTGVIDANDSWAGITRQITSTDFEQANVEYIDFWVQDPFLDDAVPAAAHGGKLFINLGNISEDVLKDGKKQFENGLPENGNISDLIPTSYTTVVPRNQSLIYTFSSTGANRDNQDVGYDGYDDNEEATIIPNGAAFGPDPANDNYRYYLNTSGDIFERYKKYNGLEGNSPDEFSDTNRGSTAQPDVEDINRDNTMNTIDSYFQYEIDITPSSLNISNPQINDIKNRNVTLPNGDERNVTWYQFRVPISDPTDAIGGITDIRSIRFARLFVNGFQQPRVLRFATLDLVRSDWRRYTLTLDEEPNNDSDNTDLNVGVVGLQENDGNYVLPPGVELEQLNNNNNIIRQNEQSLQVEVCELEPRDSRGVFKNINIDMRQYNKLRMFIHAQEGETGNLVDGDMVGFIRMGNDFTQNYYQIEVPLQVSSGSSTAENIWPEVNEINIELSVLEQIKSLGITNGTLANEDPTFYDVQDGQLTEVDEFDTHTIGQQRVAIKGNPNFGDVRVLMVGLKNPDNNGMNACAEAWFNELRLSDLDNEGGWAAVAAVDANFADFADISATGRKSTIGFGSVEQRPNERSREDVQQFDIVTNMNLGQLLPKKWGMQIPFNYGIGEEIITPEYDEFYRDIKLETQLANTNNKDSILNVNEQYTKRQSINFIGVRKNRTTDKKPRFYDVENLTLNYSYNKTEHRDFEIENSLDQNVRAGVNYNYSFEPKSIEPFKKNDSLFKGKYWKILKDFNFNPIPTSFSINTDIIRQFNKQKFREVDLTGDNIGLEELYRRNYNFNLQYVINYNLTKALSLNFTASNSNIVRNYFVDDVLNGRQDSDLDVWDGFFDFGDPNIQNQQLQINYEIPLYKIPTLSFLRATYSYTGDFQWQKGSDLNQNLQIRDQDDPNIINTYNLGNSIQNANTHNINSTLDMAKLYKYVGLVKKPVRAARGGRASNNAVPKGLEAKDIKKDSKSDANNLDANGNPIKSKVGAGTKILNGAIDLLTSVKRIQINYSENNGTFLPGYLPTPGFLGTLKPSLGFTFGSQADIRDRAARNGWLTVFPDFNQQYTEVTTKILDVSANVELIKDLKIDITGNRTYSENLTQNFNTTDLNDDGFSDTYNGLLTNSFGNFSISTALIKTAFSASDETQSAPFDDFRSNRIVIANRLAKEFYGTDNFARDGEGFPLGFGKNNQAVLLPAFLAAYKGQSADKIGLSAFRDIPIPNWQLKYTGFMKMKWFKKNFKRFSITHGYRSSYTINQFRSNLDLEPGSLKPGVTYENQDQDKVLDQAGNFKNATIFSNINLEEQFSPLFRLDFEMKNSIKILAEMKKDRILSLSFDNNLLTEIQGNEYILGLGYRIKDLRIRSKLAGPKQIIKSDLNLKADISVRNNKTIIRYLDIENNQITQGQTIWGLKFAADYAFTNNLTAIFYFDYTFSEYEISTAFPQTTIRSGFTLRYNFGN
ncbi:T9SS outer membrane translocon Sov/SprA [Psychroserpens ponticola]|uniref:Cell surface protein SprA n=1 Tax=Psychroserpens ponticola TaxID=2932268 RepID=A0ABY7S331_9FLAO|nr:cell surface protein SprA [Psychroserpens ponticola]WCO03708.1 cell surface protein SprA [Psychroserpens ponticola]